MFVTYVLKNNSGKLYIGQTNSIELRLARHNNNLVKSTKHKGPWKLIFTKEFSTRSEAMLFEIYLKRQKGGEGLKKIIGKSIES